MNPSTYELLAGIHSANAEEVVVLPNSPNVILAAERAAEPVGATRPGRPPRGRSRRALPPCWPSIPPPVREPGTPMRCAAPPAGLAIGGVAVAAKDDAQGRFSSGDAVGYHRDELVAWGDPAETLRATLARVAEGAELVTCIAGEGTPLDERRRRGRAAGRSGARATTTAASRRGGRSLAE